jgi:hypothetical protein
MNTCVRLRGQGGMDKLRDTAQFLGLADRQRVLQLVVKEVQVGPDSSSSSSRFPSTTRTPVYLLRTWHHV